MQSIAETCVRFDAAHLSINLVSEIAVPMFTTLREDSTGMMAKAYSVQVASLASLAQLLPRLRE